MERVRSKVGPILGAGRRARHHVCRTGGAVGARRRGVGDDRAPRGRRSAGGGVGCRHAGGTRQPEVPSRRSEVRGLRPLRHHGRRRRSGLREGVEGGCRQRWRDRRRASPRTRITVVAVLPNETQLQTDPVKPNHMADRSQSTYVDAIHDYLLPQMKYYETWGRDIEVKFITSSGSDEAAQRADVVAVKAMKPFAVFNTGRRRASTCSRPRSPRRRSRSWGSRPPRPRRNHRRRTAGA